ncbi:sciellin [Rhinophrynus dorsalis]
MATFSFNRSPGNDSKSSTLGSINRQHVIQETNKRRTLLTDNSWIKNRPAEEEEKIKDENYGKSVLNRYKSQDNLDSREDESKETKPLHNRFKSDDALDRISLRNTSDRGSKAATLERVPISGTSEYENKRQSWTPGNKTTTTTITDESKRKSWTPTNKSSFTTTETKPVTLPSKQEGQKITVYSSDVSTKDKPTRSNLVDSTRSRFEKPEEKPKLPPSSISPSAKSDTRPSYAAKPAVTESNQRRSTLERKQREDELDDLIEFSQNAKNSRNRDEELNSLIEFKKPETKTSQDLDDLIAFRGTNKGAAQPTSNNTTNVVSHSSTAVYKVTDGPHDAPRNSITVNTVIEDIPDATSRRSTTSSYTVNEETHESPSRRSTTRYTEETRESPSRSSTTVNKITDKSYDGPGRQSSSSYRFSDDASSAETRRSNVNYSEETRAVQPTSNNTTNVVSHSSTAVYKVTDGPRDAPRNSITVNTVIEDIPNATSRRSTSSYTVNEDTYDSPSRRSSTRYTEETRESPSRSSSTVNNITDKSYDGSGRQSTSSYRVSDDPSNVEKRRSNVSYTQETSYSSLPTDTYVYTTSYEDNRKPSRYSTYDDNVTANSIKTVYSTSDRSVIEKDMCTYCRKPLGIDAKMILKDLSICCHATCFKCEKCSGDLGGLKAGDSMWIYKQTIHCESCYFATREKWII